MRMIFPSTILVGVLGLGALTVLGGSWYTIDQGERGVILRNGAVTGTAEPGLGFKMPLVDSVERFSVQSQTRPYDGREGHPAALAAYSRDQQPASLRLSVTYRADPAAVAGLYARFGSLDAAVTRLIDPQVYEQVKTVFGRFNAITAVQERARLNQEVEDAVRAGVGVSSGIVVEGVQIENIDFSDAYEQSIEQRMLAEVEVERVRQNALRAKIDAEIAVTKAQAEADSTLAKAKVDAEATKLRGDAEALAIAARGKALQDNPMIVQLTQAERWDGRLPTTMPPAGTVPFLSVGK